MSRSRSPAPARRSVAGLGRRDLGPPSDKALFKAVVEVFALPWELRLSFTSGSVVLVSTPEFDRMLNHITAQSFLDQARHRVTRAIAGRLDRVSAAQVDAWRRAAVGAGADPSTLKAATLTVGRGNLRAAIENAIRVGGYEAVEAIASPEADGFRLTQLFDEGLDPKLAPGTPILDHGIERPSSKALRKALKWAGLVRPSLPWALCVARHDPLRLEVDPGMYATRFKESRDGPTDGEDAAARMAVLRTIEAVVIQLTERSILNLADDVDLGRLQDADFASGVLFLLKSEIVRRIGVAISRTGIDGLAVLAGAPLPRSPAGLPSTGAGADPLLST